VAADAGTPSRLFPIAFGPARLHSALGKVVRVLMIKPKVKVLWFLLLVGLAVFLLLCFRRHAVPVDRLSQVAPGMAQFEVQSLLGVPSVVRHGGSAGTTFIYLRRFMWCRVEVSFGADGRVTGSPFHDH